MFTVSLSVGDSTAQWRRERDSNPRWGYKPHTPLAGERLQPLGHLSRTIDTYPLVLVHRSLTSPLNKVIQSQMSLYSLSPLLAALA